CEKLVELKWTKYKGWDVDHYDILRWKGSGDYSVIASIPGSTDTLVYRDTTIKDGDSLCYKIRAYSNPAKATSTSNEVCLSADIINPVNDNYLRIASIYNGAVNLTWRVDLTADIMLFTVQRSTFDGGPYSDIATKKPNGNQYLSFIDKLANLDAGSYYYRLMVEDSCEGIPFYSNVARTIFISVDPKLDEVNLPGTANNTPSKPVNYLQWNNYEGWQGSIQYYNLYRSIDGGSYTLLDQIPFDYLSSFNTYEDDVSEYFEGVGHFCYYLEAIENGTENKYGLQDTVLSNVFCVDQIPRLFIPNAFIPGSEFNPEFKPVNVFEDPNNYHLKIFNRWGQLVFESEDPDQGWDGTSKSKIAPQGVYVYFIRFIGTNGHEVGKKGTLTLLRKK
ncbi:gliding motility-associated C-terminal domain-containing protein, partial [bacterium AH-315-C07]|nr:gliding motility-associated C-terminal domain-containing protein [bacterium AH-315-C07]